MATNAMEENGDPTERALALLLDVYGEVWRYYADSWNENLVDDMKYDPRALASQLYELLESYPNLHSKLSQQYPALSKITVQPLIHAPYIGDDENEKVWPH